MSDIGSADQAAVAAMKTACPVLADIHRAGDVIANLEEHTRLHAGSPVTWENMVDVQRGALIGARLYEGWAKSKEEAERMASAGQVRFIACHDVDAVSGLAGVTAPSMPAAVFENASGKQKADCRLWEPRLILGSHDVQLLKSIERKRPRHAKT